MKKSVEVKRLPQLNSSDFVVVERFDTETVETKEPTFEKKNTKGFPVVHQISVEDVEPPLIWKKQWDKPDTIGLSPENARKKESIEYFFDHNGNILSNDIGEEAIKLRDIILLVRSTVASQRNIHIQLLSTIISKSLNNEYKDPKGAIIPIFNILLSDYNLILLTRISLDDQNQGVLYSSLKLLHSIFNHKSVQIKEWYNYHRCLSIGLEYMCYSNLISPIDTSTTDSEISKSDIILGLDIMSIFSRLRYVLEVVKVPSFVDYILDILLYCSKHSTEISNSIITCPRLLKQLKSEFFDIDLNSLPIIFADNYPYKYPSAKAINLLSILCQSSAENYNIIKDLDFIPKIMDILKWSLQNKPQSDDFSLYVSDIQCEILFFIQVIGYYKYPLQNLNIHQQLCKLINHTSNSSVTPYCLRALSSLVPDIQIDIIIDDLCIFVTETKSSLFSTDLNNLITTRCLLELIDTILCKEQHYRNLFELIFNDNLLNYLLSMYSVPTIELLEYNYLALPCDLIAFFNADQKLLLSKFCIADSLNSFIKITNSYYSLNTQLLHQKLSDLEFNKDFSGSSIDPLVKFLLRPFTIFKCSCLNILVTLSASLPVQYYDICIGLISEISSCDKNLLHSLFSNVLFNKSLLSKFSPNFNENYPLILEKFYKNYIAFDVNKDYSSFFSTVYFNIVENEKLFVDINSQKLPLSFDWMLLPLSIFARKDLSTTSSIVTLVNAVAEYLLILEKFEFASIFLTPVKCLIVLDFKSLHISIKLSHYLQFFLINADIFFESPIAIHLTELLEYWLIHYQISVLTPSITTNLISEVIDHYLSCSYGNEFFGQTFFIFLIMNLEPTYRKQIYNELSDMLDMLKPSSQMPSTLFLFPKESSYDIILIQTSLLVTYKVNKDKNSFLYWLFISHISAFISENNNFSTWLKSQIKANLQENDIILNEVLLFNENKIYLT